MLGQIRTVPALPRRQPLHEDGVQISRTWASLLSSLSCAMSLQPEF